MPTFKPLVLLCLFFCLGIVLGRCLGCPVFLSAASAGIFLTAAVCCITRSRFFVIFILGAMCCLGVFDHAVSVYKPPLFGDDLFCLKGKPVFIKGVIVSDPFVMKNRVAFDLRVSEAVSGGCLRRLCARAKVITYSQGDYHYGNEVLAEGSFCQLRGETVYIVKKAQVVVFVGKGRGRPLTEFALRLKLKIKAIISEYFKPPFSGIVSAILLGEAGSIPSKLKSDMITTGTWHLMVVSGSHAALLAYVFMLIFKIAGIPRRLRFSMVIFFLIIYCLMTGSSSPVVRATVMASAFLFTYLLERNPDFLNSLALAALSILIFDPLQLFQTGFQLSFLSVFFIFWLYPKFKRVLPESVSKNRALLYLSNGFCVSTCAWLGTTPLLAFKFGSISLIAVFANMIAAPLAAFVVAGSLVFLVLAIVCPPLGVLASLACECLIILLSGACAFMAKLPFALVALPSWLAFA